MSKQIYNQGLEKAREAGFYGDAAHDYAIEYELAFDDAYAGAVKSSGKRLGAILSNPKVKGRERAALDLAIKSPAMSVDDVVSFVSENVRSGSSIAARMANEPSLGHEPPMVSDSSFNDIAAGVYGERKHR
ncbi:hypothetical protein [Microvirga flavescens]|uniref:hypothetical protein n=1 Tax=Microvirga flavescens TaxID=2249811 RepID=UPI000DD956DE|nr:hypothetical protein [Microvirga flavescens]